MNYDVKNIFSVLHKIINEANNEDKIKDSFSYKADKNHNDIYHIYYNNRHIMTQKTSDSKDVETQIEILKLCFNYGCLWALEKTVSAFKDDIYNMPVSKKD